MVESDGAVVPGVCDRNSHRDKLKLGRCYWPRKKHQEYSLKKLGLHEQLQEVVTSLVRDQYKLFTGSDSEVEKLDFGTKK